MDNEIAKLVKEMCEILTGNTHNTLSKDDYKRLESIALYVGHDHDVLDAKASEQAPEVFGDYDDYYLKGVIKNV